MVAASLSQQTVGACLLVSFQQVQRYERGSNNIPPDGLVKLAALFGCSMPVLFVNPSGKRGRTLVLSSSLRRTYRLFA
ncbi:MAG: helix-turn-helix domain-containing protein, partial [Phycisphaerales bacterium]|nr:helix-turn-helix domain-containing protein [Phycisphaerales bacterium]